jgi:hypothetical protein
MSAIYHSSTCEKAIGQRKLAAKHKIAKLLSFRNATLAPVFPRNNNCRSNQNILNRPNLLRHKLLKLIQILSRNPRNNIILPKEYIRLPNLLKLNQLLRNLTLGT